jgi:hypothetical protein
LRWRKRNAAVIAAARRPAVHDVARDPVEFVAAHFLEALADGFGPEACRRKPLAVPILLQPLRQRYGAPWPRVSGGAGLGFGRDAVSTRRMTVVVPVRTRPVSSP